MIKRKNIKNIDVDSIKDLYLNKQRTVKEVAREIGVSFWSLYDFMNKNNIARRSYSEANFINYKDKPQFELKRSLDISNEKLKVAGVMLYWAEGTLRGGTVDFTNSNAGMVRLFLKFLRKICGVKEKRLRIYIYAYDYNNLEEVKRYWHNVTKIPLSQFTKPYIRKGNLNLSGRKLPYGLVHVRYNDKRLLNTIGGWIKECTVRI